MLRNSFSILMLSIFMIGCSTELVSASPFNAKSPNGDSTGMVPEHVEFKSLDGLMISAHVYKIDDNSPVIVLCHQARYNKYEYVGIAEKLNDRGFNCVAIDQRSGGREFDQDNETNLRAIEEEKGVDYLDAEQDMVAAINYSLEKFNSPVILWGSSYSSTLALHIAIENKTVYAVICFSPGDYFSPEKGSFKDKLANYDRPMFLTSSKEEAPEITDYLGEKELGQNQVQFIPTGKGHHGSRALWEDQEGGEEYWTAVDRFLNEVKQSIKK